ncbi:MAG: DNA polymerase III subunit beta, partial [Minisyncoccia bacterium]
IKPELQGVRLFGEAGVMTAAATDSFRLAEKTVPLKSRGSTPQIIIPARNSAELTRILESHSDTVDVYYDQNQLSVQVGDVYYTTRLIDGSFPNYQQILPKDAATEAVVLREDFSDALRLLQLFTDKFLQVSFLCDPKRKVVELSSHNQDIGEDTVTLKAAVSGEPVQMNFNSRYLADGVMPLTSESVRLKIQGPGKPLVMQDAADTSYLYLAMPMNR